MKRTHSVLQCVLSLVNPVLHIVANFFAYVLKPNFVTSVCVLNLKKVNLKNFITCNLPLNKYGVKKVGIALCSLVEC